MLSGTAIERDDQVTRDASRLLLVLNSRRAVGVTVALAELGVPSARTRSRRRRGVAAAWGARVWAASGTSRSRADPQIPGRRALPVRGFRSPSPSGALSPSISWSQGEASPCRNPVVPTASEQGSWDSQTPAPRPALVRSTRRKGTQVGPGRTVRSHGRCLLSETRYLVKSSVRVSFYLSYS